MNESYLQENFAERIGGKSFGKDTAIYKFEKIKRAKREAMKKNPDLPIIDMGVGEPDEPAFDIVVNALAEEAGRFENRTYTDNGIPEFKNAVSAYMKELYGVELNPETEIIHSIGSKSALTLIPAVFINPKDITILTIPGYPVLGTWTKYLGGETVSLPLTAENNYFPDLDSLSDEQRRRAKLLYINYPNNPTGASPTEEFYKRAIEFAKKNRVLIVSDAAYAPLNFAGRPLSILNLPGGRDVSIELHSMSKGFNMTGWRLSWVCGNELAVKGFASVKDNSDSGQFAAIQKASIKALEAQSELTPGICEKYERRLRKMADTLKKLGFDAKMPQGSFDLYVKIPKGTDNGVTFDSGEDFAQWLIKEKHISAVPWDDAGACIRFSATFVARGGEKEEKEVLDEFEKRLGGTSFNFQDGAA